jgi:hypothetical protein
MPLGIIPIFTDVKFPLGLKLNVYVIADDQEKSYLGGDRFDGAVQRGLWETRRPFIRNVY